MVAFVSLISLFSVSKCAIIAYNLSLWMLSYAWYWYLFMFHKPAYNLQKVSKCPYNSVYEVINYGLVATNPQNAAPDAALFVRKYTTVSNSIVSRFCYYLSNTANFKDNYLFNLLKLATCFGFLPSSGQDKIKVYTNVLSLCEFHTVTSLPRSLRVTIKRYIC
jgi:hypothetical protein